MTKEIAVTNERKPKHPWGWNVWRQQHDANCNPETCDKCGESDGAKGKLWRYEGFPCCQSTYHTKCFASQRKEAGAMRACGNNGNEIGWAALKAAVLNLAANQ